MAGRVGLARGVGICSALWSPGFCRPGGGHGHGVECRSVLESTFGRADGLVLGRLASGARPAGGRPRCGGSVEFCGNTGHSDVAPKPEPRGSSGMVEGGSFGRGHFCGGHRVHSACSVAHVWKAARGLSSGQPSCGPVRHGVGWIGGHSSCASRRVLRQGPRRVVFSHFRECCGVDGRMAASDSTSFGGVRVAVCGRRALWGRDVGVPPESAGGVEWRGCGVGSLAVEGASGVGSGRSGGPLGERGHGRSNGVWCDGLQQRGCPSRKSRDMENPLFCGAGFNPVARACSMRGWGVQDVPHGPSSPAGERHLGGYPFISVTLRITWSTYVSQASMPMMGRMAFTRLFCLL